MKGGDDSLSNLSGYKMGFSSKSYTPQLWWSCSVGEPRTGTVLFKITCGLLEDLFFMPHMTLL